MTVNLRLVHTEADLAQRETAASGPAHGNIADGADAITSLNGAARRLEEDDDGQGGDSLP
jgi:hypothetical protein